MTEHTDERLAYIHRVLALIDPFYCDDILWRVENGTVQFSVKCSDLFWWGTADSEDVTPENIGEF